MVRWVNALVLVGLLVLGSGTGWCLDYAQDIRPILSDKCFTCHGPDGATRKADLRLDLDDAAETAEVIVAGDGAGSELYKRMVTEDLDDVMPPPETGVALTAEEIALIKAWIDEGAEYSQHWAFRTVEAPGVPSVKDTSWGSNAIDAFVLARLEAEGIAPSGEAEKEALIRRLSFDLRGLPPTLAEIDQFVGDESPDAYEALVDRFLADEAYGERMALDWLDVARYADTFGYQSDVDTNMWPWRDWVIRAFNGNQPFDEFVRDQLAGDMLPNATQEQRLATGFNRLHRQTNEGGSIEEEFRVEYVSDRTETFGTAFLGLTLECSRCHDHKYDPISMADYYSLSAFFNNIDESGLYSHFTNAVPTPSMYLYSGDQEAEHEALLNAIVEKETALAAVETQAMEDYAAWLEEEEAEFPMLSPQVHFSFDGVEGNALESVVGKAKAALVMGPEFGEGVSGEALLLKGEDGFDLKEAGQFERTDAFSFAVEIRTDRHVPHTVVFHRSKGETDAGSRGYELLLQDGKPTFSLIHFWPGNGIRVQCEEALALDRWTHLTVTYDGSSRAAGVTIYLDGVAQKVTVIRDGLKKTIKYGDKNQPLSLGHRFRGIGFKGGAVDDFMVFDGALSAVEVQYLMNGGHDSIAEIFSGQDEAAQQTYYLARVSKKVGRMAKRVARARVEEHQFIERVREIMTMEEDAERRATYVLGRGSYENRTDEVQPDTPAGLLPFDGAWPRNRMGLVQWLFDEGNPLTTRVAVNRYWKLFFGQGLVETQEDFGSQGKPPSHPALLDHLAHWFRANDWDMKGLCKYIVMSSAYRQDSTPRADLQDIDPANELVARGPRYRLAAELVRDNALAVSGLLVGTVGGPSVKPYQPEGLWKAASSKTYTADQGDGLYRRSMYTFWKRTVPPPSMMTFDAATREVCVARRERTTTPLQALVLLNDPQFVEAARMLAEQVLQSEAGVSERLVVLFRTLTSRAPRAEELAVLEAAYSEQAAYFAEDSAAAEAYVQVGARERNTELDPLALAATTAVAQVLMNFDEFQVKQ